ncbi:MAG: DUF3253 domain-containing protein [Sphingobium sp.]
MTLKLLEARAFGATVCLSEVARAMAARSNIGADTDETGPDWRDVMPIVHAAVDEMVSEGLVGLSWKGEPLAMRSGPYRINRKETDGR